MAHSVSHFMVSTCDFVPGLYELHDGVIMLSVNKWDDAPLPKLFVDDARHARRTAQYPSHNGLRDEQFDGWVLDGLLVGLVEQQHGHPNHVGWALSPAELIPGVRPFFGWCGDWLVAVAAPKVKRRLRVS